MKRIPRTTVTCLQCGAQRQLTPSQAKRFEYCSRKCRSQVMVRHMNAVRRPAQSNPSWFKKGHVPWRQGKTGLRVSPETEFQPGQLPFNHSPVWTTRLRTQKGDTPRAWVKVAEPNIWRPRAILVWEAVNGPLPKGQIVHHSDRDTLNDGPDNLEAMTRAQHSREHANERVKSENTCNAKPSP